MKNRRAAILSAIYLLAVAIIAAMYANTNADPLYILLYVITLPLSFIAGALFYAVSGIIEQLLGQNLTEYLGPTIFTIWWVGAAAAQLALLFLIISAFPRRRQQQRKDPSNTDQQ